MALKRTKTKKALKLYSAFISRGIQRKGATKRACFFQKNTGENS